MTFPIYKIQTFDKIEQLGTKEKFWFYEEGTTRLLLCKIGRPGTGENWAEKVAFEIANLLTIPCASYNFAIWMNKDCVISESFVPIYGQLIHGNELLARLMISRAHTQKYKAGEYKISTIKELFDMQYEYVELPLGYQKNGDIKSAGDMFIAYLMFDCLIANPDRHHENWGFIFDSKNKKIYLAPTYDHASGLGCRVLDEERIKRLKTHDKRYSISAFAKKAKTPIYDNNSERLTTLEAFNEISSLNQTSTDYWLNKLNNLSEDSLRKIFDKIPKKIISCAAIDFGVSLIKENKKRLLSR